ncbi:hypothetical protein COBT_000790 [Conglomerata obtusa]
MLHEDIHRLNERFYTLMKLRKQHKESLQKQTSSIKTIQQQKQILIDLFALITQKDLISDSFYILQEKSKETPRKYEKYRSIQVDKYLGVINIGREPIVNNRIVYTKNYIAKRIYYYYKKTNRLFLYTCEISDNYEMIISADRVVFKGKNAWPEFCSLFDGAFEFRSAEEFFGLNENTVISEMLLLLGKPKF